MSAPGLNFYLLDLETTGLNPKYGQEICEFSIIRASDRVQLTRQVRVERPENSNYDALKIIGKSMNDLRQGIHRSQMVAEMERFLSEDGAKPSDRCLVGHNIILFDKKWLWHYWELHNKSFPISLYLDTVHMFRAFLKKTGQKNQANLDSACGFMGLKKVGTAHSAKWDIQNTYFLWQELSKHIDFLNHIKNFPHRFGKEWEDHTTDQNHTVEENEECDP